MVNHEKRESKAPISSGSSRGAESQAMQIPSKGPKQFKNAKVKFLAVEEAIKLSSHSNSKNAGVRIGNWCSQSGPSQPLPAISERSCTRGKTTSSKCVPIKQDKIRSSTDLEKKVHLSNDENYCFESPSNDLISERLTKNVQLEDRPAKLVASSINSKPSTSMIRSKKDMKSCSTKLPSELKEIKTNGRRPEQEVKLDLAKKVRLSNGENDSLELPSNNSPSGRLTKKVQWEDRPARLVDSSINSEPSTSTIRSKKDMKSCGAELPSELKEIKTNGRRPEQEVKLDLAKKVRLSNGENDSLELPSNNSPSGRLTEKVQWEDRPARLVASSINSKLSTSMIRSKKDMNSCGAELPSELKEIKTNGRKVEQEVMLDLAKKVRLSNGENDSLELPSNHSTLGRLTKKVQLGDRLPRWVASAIKSKPSTNMIISQKDMMKSCRRPEQEAKLDLNKGKGTSSEIKEHTSLIITSNLQNYPTNEPAKSIIWKGSFQILNGHKLYEGFFACPSENICPKASDFSKQMARVLQFKLCPHGEPWPKIFQIGAPDENDIALYFYPGHFERSKEKYTSLLMLMEEYDMVLKSRMKDVELIVFPSKWLPTDFQTLEGSHFMWGAFRALKDSKMT